jgi:hypothetical protein
MDGLLRIGVLGCFSFGKMKSLDLIFTVVTVLSLRIVAQAACVNSPENRQCWGEFDINTDYYAITPDTGRTVEVKASLVNLTAVLVDGGQCHARA